MIPILWQHDASRPVGKLEGNIATFLPRTVTVDNMLDAGFQIIEQEEVDGVVYVTKARILELSGG